MPSALVRALANRHRLPHVDETNVDAFLAPAAGEPIHAVLFFTGDPVQRAESDDVAVIFPELLAAFSGRLRGAVVTPAAEEKLKARFHVHALPCLVITRSAAPVGIIAKVRDWSDYIERIEVFLTPDAPLMTGALQQTSKSKAEQGAAQ